jgi:hypothetical protein
MRQSLFLAAAFIAMAAAIAAIPSSAQAQPYYGGMMGGYGSYGMMGGYPSDDGHATGPGMMGEYGYDRGMMYGYGPHRYFNRHGYRGQHLCWHRTGFGPGAGFYGSCPR